MTSRAYYWLCTGGVIAVAVALETWAAATESQTWDEGIHISAGYLYLVRGDYGWNREHPPLVKLMCALPLLAMGLELPKGGEGWKTHNPVRFGQEFLYGNRRGADAILMAARSMNILLSGLFLGALAWWTRRRFGEAAGLVAVALCAFDPNLLAHAHYVTTDFPLAAFYFFACVLWVDYLESGRRRDLAWAAVVFALALMIKFSALLLAPTLALLYIAAWRKRPAWAFGALALAALLVVNVVYWRETRRCLLTHTTPLAQVVDRGNAIGDGIYWAGRLLHLPSHAFLTGLGDMAQHNATGHPSYLLGRQSPTGWWYYFPVALAVKSTLAGLAGLALVIVRLRRVPWWLLAPPVIYFAVTVTSAIDIGLRHILVVYPFLNVAAAVALTGKAQAKACATFALPSGARKQAVFWPGWHGLQPVCLLPLALVLLQTLECARIAPHFLAFFNAASGGPAAGPRYLLDSNIDWGQDLKNLAAFLSARHQDRAYVSYFGAAPIESYIPGAMSFPDPDDQAGWDAIDGYAAASVTELAGVYNSPNALARLRRLRPVARIGWSIYVYDFRKRGTPGLKR